MSANKQTDRYVPEPLPEEVQSFLRLSLYEDVREADHTSTACVPAHSMGRTRCLIKDEGILAGLDLCIHIAHLVDPDLEFDVRLLDGAEVRYGDVAFYLEGSERSMLTAERLMLNFMQRMSGIATLTRQFANEVRHTKTKILDTRKTTPGLRFFEKWAVRTGGGQNHRMGLYDMIMIKDNHVDFCGGISNAIETVQRYIQDNNLQIPVEIETRNLDEVKQVLDRGDVDRIMLDNYNLADLRTAVKMIGGRFETEASGGINLDTAKGIAETGVDYLSVGALTHSVKSLDISLKAAL